MLEACSLRHNKLEIIEAACTWLWCCPFQSVVKKTKYFLMNKEEKLKDYHQKLFIQLFLSGICHLLNQRFSKSLGCADDSFFPLGLCRWQPRNRQFIGKRAENVIAGGVVGKQRNIGFVGFLGKVEPKWCRKHRKWLCCEIFVTKSKLRASLAVWRNLLPYIFQGGLQPV